VDPADVIRHAGLELRLVLDQHLGEADHRVRGRAQLVAHLRAEGRELGAVDDAGEPRRIEQVVDQTSDLPATWIFSTSNLSGPSAQSSRSISL